RERFAEKQLVVVERSDCQGPPGGKAKHQLLLEAFDALQCCPPARGGREERIACCLEICRDAECALERRHPRCRPVEKILDVALGAEADDLAHREGPTTLECEGPLTLVPPAGALRS